MKSLFWPPPSTYRDIDLGLDRVELLLKRLNNPHLKIPPTIHIAGTNGKGSTLAFLRAIFVESGLRVHAYTSPHLVNFNERIILANQEISDDFFNEVLLETKVASEIAPQIPVTFFEGITVAAFLAFSKIDADVLLLEVGMGGRLDATNVLKEVLCSVITPIALDHQDFLGDDLTKIAFEKAGIIKENCPVIIGRQDAEVLSVLINQANKLNAKINQNYKISVKKNSWFFNDLELPFPSLIGAHQIENAALAIAAALQTGFKITPEIIKSAIVKTNWSARLQKIIEGRFLEKVTKNSELYLDGSHNLQGAATVLEFLEKQKDKKIIVIFSMLKDKDCEGFLKIIAGKIDKLIAMEIPREPKSRSASEIRDIAEKLLIKNVEEVVGFDDAFDKITGEKDALILICGSLYLAGVFLEENFVA
jgi:dihydrofolate synthase/folylpolyglutamate synthase